MFSLRHLVAGCIACCGVLHATATLQAADQLLQKPMLATYGLTRSWFAQAPAGSDGYRVIDAQYHTGELFVLTEAGSLSCFDGATGMRKWQVRVGDPRNNYLPMGVGTNAVGVICGTRLYAVGRKDEKVVDTTTYTIKPATPIKKGTPEAIRYRMIPLIGKVIFETKTEYVPAAAPAVSENTVFMPNLSGLIDRYDLASDAKVRYLGSIQADGQISTQPVVSGSGVGWISETGSVGLATMNGEKTFYTYRVRGAGMVSPGVRGNSLYSATDLGQISQFSGEKGEPKWTASIGVGVYSSPVVLENCVYVIGKDFRLFKLQSDDGRELWQAPGIRKFLAQSKTRVYAIDETRRMTILDAATGSVLATVPLPEYEFPITNTHSDQIFFATTHGLVQELHESALTERVNYYVAPSTIKEAPTKKPVKPVVPDEGAPAPSEDPFAPAPANPAPAGDPFAPAPANPPAAADPFAPAPAGGAMPAADPFAPAPAGGAMPADPFAK